jgi:putative CocE/NonD family hydrolase
MLSQRVIHAACFGIALGFLSGGVALSAEPIFVPGSTEFPQPLELHGVRVPMHDGVTLAADVFLADAAGRYPVIVELTPYGRGPGDYNMRYEAPFWAAHGYAFVMVDTRGQGESGGTFELFRNEVNDGFDLIEWIAAQSWSNGRIGMRGASYSGSDQWMTAKRHPPHLRCLTPSATALHPMDSAPFTGGALMLGWALSWVQLQSSVSNQAGPAPEKPPAIDWSAVLAHRPLLTADVRAYGKALPLYATVLRHPTLDDYWKSMEFEPADFDRIDIPTLAFTGWFDGTITGTMYAYAQMRARSPARDHQYLVVGPWEHLTTSDGGYDYVTGKRVQQVGDLTLPDSAFVYGQDLARRFFDWCLKDGPPFEQPSARFFLTGSNRWLDLPTYPAPGTRELSVYLHSHGHAQGLRGDGMLRLSRPRQQPADRYTYDPTHPLSSMSPRQPGAPMGLGQPMDISATIDRADVLVYVGERLSAPLTVLGEVKLVLHATSDAKDTDFVSFIEDVAPDGKSIKLGSGVAAVTRARFRNGYDREQLLTPGEPATFVLNYYPIGHTFLAGHRVRISVTSSAYPFVSANPNTGNPIATDVDVPRIAHQSVLHDPTHASHLVLPVVPTPGSP